MMKRYLLLSTLLVVSLLSTALRAGAQSSYEAGMLYIKYAKNALIQSKSTFSNPHITLQINEHKAVLPDFKLLKSTNNHIKKLQNSDLKRIYRVHVSGTDDMELAGRLLSQDETIEYAEPIYYHQLFLTPNDPLFSENGQAYLQAINANTAWDITTGDSTVRIGIIDTGTRLNHLDLVTNRWRNPGETGLDANGNNRATNNIDDDGNGFVDDADGWDFAEDDNNPDAGSSSHGTHVTGIAAAVTDNAEGVASLGFNTQFLPIKVTNDAGGPIQFGFEAMLYASGLGIDVINASWGSTQFSQFGRDVVEAVTNSGTLIVAAAGNENDDQIFFPAGYPEVIAVAASTVNREKAIFSSFGSFVDISAPGNNILSTVLPENGGLYALSSGTSMATPVISAMAALIKAHNPNIDVDHIRARIIAAAQPMNVPSGADFHPLELGNGFLLANNALGADAASLEVFETAFDDSAGNNNGVFETGDIINANIRLKNYGISLSSAMVEITSLSAESFPFADGSVAKEINLSETDHSELLSLPTLQFQITSQAEIDQKVLLQLTYRYPDGTETAEVITTTLLPSFTTLSANTIELSIDGKGHIGFSNFPENTKGSSFIIRRFSTTETLLNVPLLREGGVMFGDASENGNNSFAVSNGVRNANPNDVDDDFLIREPIIIETIDELDSQRSSVIFTDLNAGSETYNIIIRNETFVFNETGHDKYALLQYTFDNQDSQRDYNNFRAGLFLDFDLPFTEAANDTAWYDEANDIIIMQNKTNPSGDTLFIGTTIAEGIGTPWIIDNARTDAFFFGIDDGFTEEEKWRSLSVGQLSEGSRSLLAGPGNLSFVMGSQNLTLPRDQTVVQNFILAYAFDRDELLTQINNGRNRVEETVVSREDENLIERPEDFKIQSIFPNPFNPITTISFQIPTAQNIQLELYNILGRKVQTLMTGRLSAGIHTQSIDASSLASGIYIVLLRGEQNFISRQKITLIK